ncbi:putative regulator of gluconeogenesis Rmd5 [Ascobolus immersus RN42]|uniref:GID complex catalytic subunit 2 n=1 Tax=Ascobolus immersus RN42 TaxID=1160509 RepID=A0A3N4I3S2_ASCIM|nr:putative regulator of gluconeogenesis Rmd5 [Ascobolus immersus RN42]
MEALQKELSKLESKANLSKPSSRIDDIIKLLEDAKASIQANPSSTKLQLAKLQQAATKEVDKLNHDVKEVYKGINSYSKALDKKFKSTSLEDIADLDYDAIGPLTGLVNRAVAMHLAREGKFNVAEIFMKEVQQRNTNDETNQIPTNLRAQFETMYEIVACIADGDLEKAIQWARQNEQRLNERRSRLEWELVKTKFLSIAETEGHAQAMLYGREQFSRFLDLYKFEIQQVVTGPMFVRSETITARPYPHLQTITSAEQREQLSAFFCREYCSLMGLSASSPLYLAATAGAIALPKLVKVSSIMKDKKTAWTSHNELPVEIPLPPSFTFHSIVVCPVSKEQTTEQNPPMMLPCGHVIAKESLERLTNRGVNGSTVTMKCPYCPKECKKSDAERIYL